MWRTFSRAKQRCRKDWVILLENDADFRLDPNWLQTFRIFTVQKPDAKVVWLDHRAGAQNCCTVAVAYHRTVLDQMILDFSYTTAQVESSSVNLTGHITQVGSRDKRDEPYWKDYHNPLTPGQCKTDLYLGDLMGFRGIPSYSLGIIYHPGQGGSTADGLPSEIENVSEEAMARTRPLQQLQEKMMSLVAEGKYGEAAEVKKEIEGINKAG